MQEKPKMVSLGVQTAIDSSDTLIQMIDKGYKSQLEFIMHQQQIGQIRPEVSASRTDINPDNSLMALEFGNTQNKDQSRIQYPRDADQSRILIDMTQNDMT